jgi:DNA ligase (NAD+)
MHEEELAFLQEQGFPINPLNKKTQHLEQIWEIKEDLEKNKENLKYPIDGLVIKLNDNDLVEKLGIVGKTRRAWSAIKFRADETTTKITNVTWQVGRTGKITPVAELEPAQLAGTTVKRATLHNFKEFKEKELQKNDVLIVRKAGDIIPEVLNVLINLRQNDQEIKFEEPKKCPSCKQNLELSETGVDLICINFEHCPAQVLGRLSYFCQRNVGNIKGLSNKLLEKFIKLFAVKDIPDLYNLPYQEIASLEGFGQKSKENLQKSVEESKSISDYKFFSGIGIEGIGPEVAKLILEKLESKDLLKED